MPYTPLMSAEAVSAFWDEHFPQIQAGNHYKILEIAPGEAVLRLEPATANENGESWACISVSPNAEGRVDSAERVRMVHTNHPLSDDETNGLCPVALILWRGKAIAAVHELLFFNVRYQLVKLPAGQGPARHVFF